jgi:3-oxosteroid 1-dehydrogenase
LPDGRPEALIVGKSMPGCIMVNQCGERFTNDAAPYEDVVKGQYRAHSKECSSVPCYLVFDGRFRHSYPVGLTLGPGKAMPDAMLPREYLASGWLKKSDTLAGLAQQLKVDPARLQATVERHNEFARTGKDLDFGRGDSLTDRYYSDHSVKPNSCMAPIAQAPFYALEIWPGDLGTKGGLLSDEHARVLLQSGEPIAGLYVTGNCSASVMGNTYPGAGATLGPAMTFGYVAAQHAAASVA